MNFLKLTNSADTEHSRKVSQISGLMAEKAGYSQDESQSISQAALYHDVGKSSIPAYILNKPAALTPDEYDIIKTHTAIGAEILTVAAILAEQHHERIDGNGYHRLSSGKIHPYAKLVACADVFDALYSHRAYKKPWDMAKIREYFNAQAGTQFNPAMVQVLFSIIEDVLNLYKR